MNDLWSVYEFRLLPTEEKEYNWLRYDEDSDDWIPDDGEHSMAFIHLESYPTCLMVEVPYRENILWSWMDNKNFSCAKHRGIDEWSKNPWHYMLREDEADWGNGWGRDKHLNSIIGRKGMNYITDKRGCANGRHVEFNIQDSYIKLGLLRRKDTKEIVKIPEKFICIYCGELEYPDYVQSSSRSMTK